MSSHGRPRRSPPGGRRRAHELRPQPLAADELGLARRRQLHLRRRRRRADRLRRAVRRAGLALAALLLAGMALVGIGLLCVWLETRPPAARAARVLQPAHLVDDARGLRRDAADAGRAGRGAGLSGFRGWPRALALVFVYCQAPHAAGGQGHPGLARAAGRAADRADRTRRRRRAVLLAAPGSGRRGRSRCCRAVRCRGARARCGLAWPTARVATAPRRARWPRSTAPAAVCSSPARCCRWCCWRWSARGVVAGALAALLLRRWPACSRRRRARGSSSRWSRAPASTRASRWRICRCAACVADQLTGRIDMGAITNGGNRSRRVDTARAVPAPGAGDDAARAARRAAARAAARHACATPTTTCRCTARGSTPPASRPTTSAASPTCSSCRSPSRPTCATTIRSACSRGRAESWRACTRRRARPASRPSSATRARTSTPGPT